VRHEGREGHRDCFIHCLAATPDRPSDLSSLHQRRRPKTFLSELESQTLELGKPKSQQTLVRAKAKIGMKNLACNMRRLGQLRRINPNPA